MQITNQQARKFLLAYHGLLQPREFEGKEGVMQYLRKVGCIQYDPLNKVGRNADLVLQSRIKGYQPEMLFELLYEERQLIDGWDKNMSIYPVEDRPYFTRYHQEAKEAYGSANRPILKVLEEIRQIISEQGPVSSKDINLDLKIDWSWGPTRIARAALESMFFWGELIIHHKAGVRRVYDFASKHIDSDLLEAGDPNHTLPQFFEWVVKRRIGGIGLLWNRSGDAWLGIRWMKAKDRNQAIAQLVEQQSLAEVEVERISYPCYVRKEQLESLEEIANKDFGQPQVSFIAPLDNFIWDRRLIKNIFDFEYTWEVYKPRNQRIYGYYVLLVLYGTSFIARWEPVFDKKRKRLVVHNWWWEEGCELTVDLKSALKTALEDFCNYLGAKGIETKKEAAWLGDLM